MRLLSNTCLSAAAVAAMAAASPTVVLSPELTTLEGFDNAGGSILVEPVADSVRRCLVRPEADKFTLNLACAPGNKLYVNGAAKSPGDFKFPRDRTRHTQVVEVSCAEPRLHDPVLAPRQKYALLVNSDWEEKDIPVPSLVIDDLGVDCIFENDVFKCPLPKNHTTPIRLVSNNEPSIKYILSDSSGKVDVRLLDGHASIPFRPTNTMYLKAVAGQYSKEWPVVFGGSLIPTLLNGLGWLLAILLGVLLFALIAVVGSASLCGLGVPFGATEIAAALTLLMQYLCFANFIRGTSVMESLTTPMKWVTMFWPAPLQPMGGSHSGGSVDGGHFSQAYGMKLWGNSRMGDVTDIRDAWGCMVWSALIMATLIIVHGIIFSIVNSNSERYTVPHRLTFGNWESRFLNLLAFPLATAAAIGMTHEKKTGLTIAAGAVVLALLAIWIGSVCAALLSQVSSKEVCWIWNSSVRQSGSPSDDSSGYWSDVSCDQLLTHPVNRSVLPFFTYRWISTVADIAPTSLSDALLSNSNEEIYPPKKMKKAHRQPDYPLATAPQVVSVVRTSKPGCCVGQRLMAGLLRTKWLDLMFTYEGLTKFFTQEHGHVEVPLVVKTSQLSGPLTSGKNAFFYDGARVPFIRIAESIYKILIGICCGLCAMPALSKMHSSLFGVVAVLSVLFAIYIASTSPYSRKLENWLMLITVSVIAGTSGSLMYYKIKEHVTGTDIFLWILSVTACCLAAYAAMVTFCLFSAICCPPLHESRFLEKLSNCSIIVTSRGSDDQFEIPGYSKYAPKDLLAQSRSGRVQLHKFGTLEEMELNFDQREIRNACRSGVLPIP